MGLRPSRPSASACPGVEGAVEVEDKSGSGANRGEEWAEEDGVEEAGEGDEAIELLLELTPSSACVARFRQRVEAASCGLSPV
jgi:hypothetical protein